MVDIVDSVEARLLRTYVSLLGRGLASSRCSPLTPWSQTLLQKSPVVQLFKNFASFYGTQSLITLFRNSPPLVSVLKYINIVQSFLVLTTHLRLGFPSDFLFWLSHQNYTRIPVLPFHAIHPVHLILLSSSCRLHVDPLKVCDSGLLLMTNCYVDHRPFS
jgi:hypothetical protein